MRIVLALLISLPLTWLPIGAQQPAAAPPAAQPEAKPEAKPAAPPEAKPEAQPEAKPAESPAPTQPAEQSISGSIDFGYRWSGVGGNYDSYRSVVNLGQGPKLFGWDFSITDPKKKYFDRIDTEGLGWGGDPYTTARLHARKMGTYDLTVDYRNIAYFNALPSYADPLMNIQQGFFLDENSFDLRRRMLDLELDLRPGKRVVPYFNYNRNWNSGQGITTFVANQTSYPVGSQSNDTTDSFRGGVHIEMNKWHLTLEQGGVNYGENDLVTNSQRNLGNVPAPFLGQQLYLGALNQNYGISGSTIYSKALATAHPFSWVDLYGSFLYSQPKDTVHYSESATGEFVNLTNLLFYTGQTDLVNAAAKQPHTSGGAGAEIRPFRRLRIIESWSTDRLHDASGGLNTQQLLAANPLASTTSLIAGSLVRNYSQQEVDAMYDIGSHLTLRGGYRYVWGDAIVPAPVLTESGPFQSAQLTQNVGLAGATFRAWKKLTANFDLEGASSSHDYFRTSLYDYQRARIRARYQATASLSLNAYFSVLNNSNPTPGINYSYLSRDNSVSVLWTPNGGKRVSLTGDYSRSTLHSDLSYLVPQDLTTAFDHYRDNAHTASSVVDVSLPGYAGMVPKISFGGSLFISSGSRPERFYQPLARLSIPLVKHLSWNSEWRYYGFGEQFYLYEGFRAQVLQTGLRLIR